MLQRVLFKTSTFLYPTYLSSFPPYFSFAFHCKTSPNQLYTSFMLIFSWNDFTLASAFIILSTSISAAATAAKSLQSCSTLCDPPIAHQAPPSLGFSRQEHWSGLPFPSPMRESEVTQSCLTLSDPMDHSLPGSSLHGIFKAKVLEWGAIAFSDSTV